MEDGSLISNFPETIINSTSINNLNVESTVDVRPLLDYSDGGSQNFHLFIFDWIFLGACLFAFVSNLVNLIINYKYFAMKLIIDSPNSSVVYDDLSEEYDLEIYDDEKDV